MGELINLLAESEIKQRAMLVGIKRREDSMSTSIGLLDELEELVGNLDIEVVGKEIVNLREPSAHFLIGSGNFQKVVDFATEYNADYIVVDEELSPAQQRNWEVESKLMVINRQEVILDIFAQRAQTKEARLQVELAQLEYSLPRLRKAWSHLDRQRGGGVTQRGGGESQLELDKRFIGERIAKLKIELAYVKTMRNIGRKRRTRLPVPTAAVVGYTNAGKSSLINALAKSDLLAQDKLFATLDPTTRRLELPNGSQILLTDTVGFVRKLPHRFIEAFKSTLEETVVSEFILHVVDCSSLDAIEHIKTTTEVLRQLGADEKKIVMVMNKSDAISEQSLIYELKVIYPESIFISAKTGYGLPTLLDKMQELISDCAKPMHLSIPHSNYKEISQLYQLGAISSQKNNDDGVEIFANIPIRLVSVYEKWLI